MATTAQLLKRALRKKRQALVKPAAPKESAWDCLHRTVEADRLVREPRSPSHHA
ncbi:MAG TPA: hypothetical protein VFF16_19110 [Telluria sp.]|nr:hypothetical protein [Telluria sp.]